MDFRYIGVAVSVVCCVLTLITHAAFSELRTTAKWILCNLFVALVVGEVLFVAGIVASAEGDGIDPGLCTAIGIGTHYSLLVAFGWMLMDGLFVFYLFTDVYAAHRRDETVLFRRYAMSAYGAPLVIVAVTLGVVGPDTAYGGAGHCFLVSVDGNGAIWAFTGPMAVVLVLNLFMLSRVIRVVYSATVRRRSNLSKTEQEKLEGRVKLKRALHASFSFFCRLGLGC